MVDHPDILAECNADTLLLQVILGDGGPVHSPNKGQLAKTMNSRPNKRLIGIVDNDKQKFFYVDDFIELVRENGLILRKHPEREHFTIVVDPAWEKWVWNCCEISEVDASRFGFKNWKALMSQSKRDIRLMNPKVKELLNTLKQKRCPGFVTLQTFIDDVQSGRYS